MIIRQAKAVNLLTATLLAICALHEAHGLAANPDSEFASSLSRMSVSSGKGTNDMDRSLL